MKGRRMRMGKFMVMFRHRVQSDLLCGQKTSAVV